MAYIYQIENDINHKKYIGKTEFSIEKRFKEHCRDSRKNELKTRPLYSAMQKYGESHFHISLIEETNNPNEREKYWIEKLGTFKNGYNATLGGDGIKYIDYDLVIATYLQVKNEVKVAQQLNISKDSVCHILKECKIETLSSKEVSHLYLSNPINQYTLTGEYIQSFASAKDAVRFIFQSNNIPSGAVSHITDVCKGRRKTAYKYIWKYANNMANNKVIT